MSKYIHQTLQWFSNGRGHINTYIFRTLCRTPKPHINVFWLVANVAMEIDTAEGNN